MIAQKIQRNFQGTDSSHYIKNNINTKPNLQNNIGDFDVQVQKLQHKSKIASKTTSIVEGKHFKLRKEETAEREKLKMQIINAQNAITPLTVPKQIDFSHIPNIDEKMFQQQNNLQKKKSHSFYRKIIRKRQCQSSNIQMNNESKQSIKTSTELQQEFQIFENKNIENYDKIKEQTFQQTNKKYENPIIQSKQDQITICDFNYQSNIKNQQIYYVGKLVSLLLDEIQDNFMAQMYINHFMQTYKILQEVKNIEIKQEYFPLQKITEQKKKQKTLVIDLDETLVHCNESQLLPKDFIITVKLENETSVKAEISIRPYAQQFLKNMSQYYEIMIFTASNEDYANQIIDYLDPNNEYVQYRLFRKDCINISLGCHIKDLRVLNRDLKDIILIDNSAFSFVYQLNNGIPIIPYIDNKKDNELEHLEQYLISLLDVDDIRISNQQNFHLQYIQNCSTIQQAIKHLICNRL